MVDQTLPEIAAVQSENKARKKQKDNYNVAKEAIKNLDAEHLEKLAEDIDEFPSHDPKAANMIGTPKGKVPSIKKFCTGALPVNLDIRRLSLRRLIALCVCPTPLLINSSMSNRS